MFPFICEAQECAHLTPRLPQPFYQSPLKNPCRRNCCTKLTCRRACPCDNFFSRVRQREFPTSRIYRQLNPKKTEPARRLDVFTKRDRSEMDLARCLYWPEKKHIEKLFKARGGAVGKRTVARWAHSVCCSVVKRKLFSQTEPGISDLCKRPSYAVRSRPSVFGGGNTRRRQSLVQPVPHGVSGPWIN